MCKPVNEGVSGSVSEWMDGNINVHIDEWDD